jgi:hypothetical protein
LAEKVGISTVVDMTRRFGITTPLPPYLPLALGAADMKLIEHVSAFTVFPNDGIRIDPHMIRRVTSYDGALLEEAHPEVHDVVSPDVARTMTAMLEEVIQFGTGIQARSLGRPAAGKTGTTQDYTDAWFIGFAPQLTTGVWVGYDDKQISLGKKETGARAALPIWLEFMQSVLAGLPVLDFANVVPLEQQVGEHHLHVDTPDTAPTEDEPAEPKEKSRPRRQKPYPRMQSVIRRIPEISREVFFRRGALHLLHNNVQGGALDRSQVHLGRVHCQTHLPKDVACGVFQTEICLKLRADSQGAGIGQKHALYIAIQQRLAAIKAEQGRADGIRERTCDGSSVGILEIQHERRPGCARQDLDGHHLRIPDHVVELKGQRAIRSRHIRTLNQWSVGSGYGKDVEILKNWISLNLYVEDPPPDMKDGSVRLGEVQVDMVSSIGHWKVVAEACRRRIGFPRGLIQRRIRCANHCRRNLAFYAPGKVGVSLPDLAH